MPRRVLSVHGQNQRRYDRQWKFSAAFLGLAALLIPAWTVSALNLSATVEIICYFTTMAAILVLGTLWLVPRPSRHTGWQRRR